MECCMGQVDEGWKLLDFELIKSQLHFLQRKLDPKSISPWRCGTIDIS